MRATNAFDFDLVGGLAQPGRVEHVQRQAVDLDALAQHVARRPGNGRHDRGVVAGEAIEQAGFAGIRPTGDARESGHRGAARPAVRSRRARRTVAGRRSIRSASARSFRKSTSSSGKSIAASDPHPQFEHALRQLVHLRREFALQRAQCRPRRLRRAAVDQVGDRFGLREVELVVEVGALRELARPAPVARRVPARGAAAGRAPSGRRARAARARLRR